MQKRNAINLLQHPTTLKIMNGEYITTSNPKTKVLSTIFDKPDPKFCNSL